MATPMRCRAHGRLTGDVCDQPGCFELIEPDVRSAEGHADVCSSVGCDMPVPCPLHSTGARRDAGDAVAYMGACSAELDAHARDGLPVTAVEMRFPWGVVGVHDGRLVVGRDYGALCGAEIEDFPNVSRLHATVTLRSGQLFVEDHASTNGTSVNGRRIVEFEPVTIVDGDVVGFGAHLRAVVSTGRGAQ